MFYTGEKVKRSLMIKTISNDYKSPTWAFIFYARNTNTLMRNIFNFIGGF